MYGVCNTIIEGKSYAFKNPQNNIHNLSCNSKNALCIIECYNCKKIDLSTEQQGLFT